MDNSSSDEIRLKIPFQSNTSDDTHCFQAAMAMVLGYFRPDQTYTWDELDEVTAHTATYTWPLAGSLYAADLGLQVTRIELFDYPRFIKKGVSYLFEYFSYEIAVDQLKNSDIGQEVRFAEDFVSRVDVHRRAATRSDLLDWLAQGGVPICNVNARALRGVSGYAGHFVVVTGIDANGITLHDPGLPPQKGRRVTWPEFDRAWAYPTEQARNMLGFRAQN